MRDDVALGLALAVRIEPVLEAKQGALPGVAVEGALEHRLIVREHRQQRRQVRRVPAAVDPGLGQGDVAAGQNGAREPPVAKPEFAMARVVIPRAEPATVTVRVDHRPVRRAPGA